MTSQFQENASDPPGSTQATVPGLERSTAHSHDMMDFNFLFLREMFESTMWPIIRERPRELPMVFG